ncbi:MAG: HEAT repeat domain-containing protein [FCB group bacterium]|jgi:HEAT repeat protein|nr:HEAT repeat domain-containing protein [FCB group bacterium]
MDTPNGSPLSWQGEPIPFDASIEELRERIRAPGEAAWAAFRVLARRDSEEALDVLVAATRYEDPFLRRGAVEALGLHPRGCTRGEAVAGRLRDSNEYVVRAACAAAGNLGLLDVHDEVRGLLGHAAVETREAAVGALGALWKADDFEAVFRLSRKDLSREVREAAAWVLRAHSEADNWRVLFEAWRCDDMPRHRVWACELAEAFGDEGVTPSLEQMLSDSDGHVRGAAGRALAALRGTGSA